MLGGLGLGAGVVGRLGVVLDPELQELGQVGATDLPGVSSGIDMALTLAGEIGGPDLAQLLQLGIEYDPQPPYDAGSEAKAPDHIVQVFRENSRFILEG